jgi:hypothetical protein
VALVDSLTEKKKGCSRKKDPGRRSSRQAKKKGGIKKKKEDEWVEEGELAEIALDEYHKRRGEQELSLNKTKDEEPPEVLLKGEIDRVVHPDDWSDDEESQDEEPPPVLNPDDFSDDEEEDWTRLEKEERTVLATGKKSTRSARGDEYGWEDQEDSLDFTETSPITKTL